MIIVRLMGGLGNQMFQYAAGKALADRLGVSLQLDRTFLDQRSENPGYTLRNFELDVFQISAGTAEKSVVARMRKPLENSMHRKLSNMFPSLIRNHVFSETQKKLIKEFELLTDPVYMEGYWQTEKYFLSIADQLRSKDFIPVAAISSMNVELLRKIGSTSSVSMHVRRGDYVT
ncbi:MAG: alpha-1,2-fucosyltransferase, partial [Chryseobacterium sp.]